MKKVIFLIMIITLQTACKSRQVAVNSFKAKSELDAEQSTKVNETTDINVQANDERKTASYVSSETSNRDSLEFDADSGTYNANTGEWKFRIKGKTKFTGNRHNLTTDQRTTTSNKQVELSATHKKDSTDHSKKKLTISSKGKSKEIKSKVDLGTVMVVAVSLFLIGMFVIKIVKR